MNHVPLAIVGDVHGEAIAFDRALRAYAGRRPLVLVGDYVNRGRGSDQVLAMLGDLLDGGDGTALLGNHDYALLRYIETGDLAPFARMGGLATISSYAGVIAGDPHAALLSTLPATHLDTLKSLAHCYEDDSLLVSHCGVSPSRPNERSVQDLVLGSHPELFGSEASGLPKVVVSGHYAQRGRTPYVSERYICVDVGCGTIPGAPLAVLEWPERKFKYFEVS